MKIFDLDGPFQKYGTIVFDIIVMNTLWFIVTFFSLGILSGPALTGTYAGLYSGIVTGEGYTFKEFFRRFKNRFLPSFLFGLLHLLLLVISIGNIYLVVMTDFGASWLLPVYIFIILELGFVGSYAYPLLAHTELKFKEVIKISFFLSNKHLPTTILSVALNAIVVVLIILVVVFQAIQFGIYLFAATGIVVTINSYLISKRILNKYDFFEAVER